MKLSQFTMFVEVYPETGHHLVYNTLTRAFMEINDQCLSVLHSLVNHESLASRDIGEIPHHSEETFPAEPVLKKLQALGIVVPEEQDETQSFCQTFSNQRLESKEIHATVLTTLDCPMQCVYCYQSHIKDSGPMSTQTTERVALWLEKQLQINKSERCFITFYGGEPLMNTGPIEYIARRMRGYCSDRGIKLAFAMVTSGILLTPQVAEKLKKLGVRHLQITLDGDREAHDRRRCRKDGSGTYDVIMESLSYLVKDSYITILCNVDRANVQAAYRLVDILYSCGYADKLSGLIFGPVSAPYESAISRHIACPGTDDRGLTLLNIYAAQRGFASDLRPRHTICGMLLPSRFVIDTEGGIYTCPAFLGRKEYQAGMINEIDNNAGVKSLIDFNLGEECLRCLYVPFCTGGCRYNALVETGDIRAVNCQKETFSYSLPLLLKAHYELRSRHGKGPEPNQDSIIPAGEY